LSYLRDNGHGNEVSATSLFLALAYDGEGPIASCHLIFPPTVYGKCSHYNPVGYGCTWNRNPKL